MFSAGFIKLYLSPEYSCSFGFVAQSGMGFVTGHGFSRADKARTTNSRALAPAETGELGPSYLGAREITNPNTQIRNLNIGGRRTPRLSF
jgi:hypothetical protein